MRDSADITSWVLRAVSQRFSVPREDLNRATRFREDLDADSLDAMELVIEVEGDFELAISDQAMEEIRTIGDLIEFLEGEGGLGSAARLKPPPRSDAGGAAAV